MLVLSCLLFLCICYNSISLKVHRLFPLYQSSKSISSSTIGEEHNYIWKYDYEISYVKSGDETKPALLLIPGFGVGKFHYDRNILNLSKDFQIFSLDLLGQGKSWPKTHPTAEQQLCYSVETWVEQVQYFIENIIKRPVHIAGNSLGGYLAVCLAFAQPSVVKSLILLNASPFWAFLPPKNILRSLPFLWGGILPPPQWLLQLGSYYFDNLRRESTVTGMLSMVSNISN